LDRLLDDVTATVSILAAGRMALRRFVADPEFEDDRQALATAAGDVRRGLVEELRLVTEAQNGFPYFGRLGVAWLWTVLEAFVEDEVASSVRHQPALLDTPPFARAKRRLPRHSEDSDEEWYQQIVARVARSTERRDPVEQLLFMLRLVGFAVHPDAETKSKLRELAEVRNVILHRRGVADARLLAVWSGPPLSVGDAVVVASSDLHDYAHFVLEFASAVVAAPKGEA
jgi:hypothetical protein